MTELTDKQRALLVPMTDYVLEHGLPAASLRPLAKAADTSDRMLIYHFGTKENLIGLLLSGLAAQFTEHLDASFPPERSATTYECITRTVAIVRRPEMQSMISLWLDIVAVANRGHAHHQATGQTIVDGFLDWLAARVPETVKDKPAMAAAMLTMIEGAHTMDALGKSVTADRAIETMFGNNK